MQFRFVVVALCLALSSAAPSAAIDSRLQDLALKTQVVQAQMISPMRPQLITLQVCTPFASRARRGGGGTSSPHAVRRPPAPPWLALTGARAQLVARRPSTT